jgi:hypothetical protein
VERVGQLVERVERLEAAVVGIGELKLIVRSEILFPPSIQILCYCHGMIHNPQLLCMKVPMHV